MRRKVTYFLKSGVQIANNHHATRVHETESGARKEWARIIRHVRRIKRTTRSIIDDAESLPYAWRNPVTQLSEQIIDEIDSFMGTT